MIAILNFIGIAGWRKFAEIIRITAIVCRAVAAHQVDDQYGVLLQSIIQTGEVHIVNAGVVFAELIEFPLGHVGMGNAIAGAFTTAIIVTPQHIDPRMGEHVQQPFLVMGQVGIVFTARHTGEHAGYGNGCFGAAGGGLREVNHILLFQLGVCFTPVAIQGVVRGA